MPLNSSQKPGYMQHRIHESLGIAFSHLPSPEYFTYLAATLTPAKLEFAREMCIEAALDPDMHARYRQYWKTFTYEMNAGVHVQSSGIGIMEVVVQSCVWMHLRVEK
ncbi:hypothetical protein K469DRAFT_754148 [Zopfia rhizophila CBS 207.26]|uniref:Uncharacterized protein n=1 Tax=Zopfia rhizophila CBS 207.26 TaxID=1314779 RepID=A0A6A6DIV9_9PEZI|nr:hypothetical protein K469DRAFT_754148 [Zopfia rhizophila CBS 207.26]